MVTVVFYRPFLHVFYAACMFYGTAFMYNHAISCIFSPNLEAEMNIIICQHWLKLTAGVQN